MSAPVIRRHVAAKPLPSRARGHRAARDAYGPITLQRSRSRSPIVLRTRAGTGGVCIAAPTTRRLSQTVRSTEPLGSVAARSTVSYGVGHRVASYTVPATAAEILDRLMKSHFHPISMSGQRRDGSTEFAVGSGRVGSTAGRPRSSASQRTPPPAGPRRTHAPAQDASNEFAVAAERGDHFVVDRPADFRDHRDPCRASPSGVSPAPMPVVADHRHRAWRARVSQLVR